MLALLPTTDVILVETGDLERLEAYRGLMSDAQWSRQRAVTLARIDAFLARISSATPGNTMILLLVAAPSTTGGNDFPLLPLLIDWKREEPGLLTSPSTRQPGLITGGDLAGLIVDLTSGTPEGTNDRWTTGGGGLSCRRTALLGDQFAPKDARFPSLSLFTSLSAPLGVVVTVNPVAPLAIYTRASFPAIAVLPLTLLLLAPFRITHGPLFALCLVLGSGGIWAFIRMFFPTRLLAYRGLFMGTSLVILVDLFFGARLMLPSLLGPSPVLGHRFYGLGNEYLGVFLGTCLLGAADFLLHSPWRMWSGLLLGGVALLVFSPFGGANFGSGVALIYAGWQIGRRIRPPTLARRNLVLFSLCLVVGLGVQLVGVETGDNPSP